MKMKIEDFVERWNDERPEGFIAMSEKQKKEEFKKFCDWNGFDLTNLIDLLLSMMFSKAKRYIDSRSCVIRYKSLTEAKFELYLLE